MSIGMNDTGVSGARIYGLIQPEESWGVLDDAADPIVPEIQAPDSFVITPEIIPWEGRRAPDNLPYKRGRKRYSANFSMKFSAYPTQIVPILGWAITTTADGAGNKRLGSMTLGRFEGVKKEQITGCRVRQIQATANSSTDRMDVTISGQGAVYTYGGGVTIAEPAAADYPPEDPYFHQDSIGRIVLNGTTYTDGYTEASFNIQNQLAAKHETREYVTALDYSGRTAEWTFIKRYVDTEFFALWFDQVPFSASLKWRYPLTPFQSFQLDFKDKNRVTARTEQRNFEGTLFESITGRAHYSPTTGLDMALVFATV